MSSDDEKINATMIIEVIGRPPEHLIETLNDIVKKIDEEKGVKVVGKKINEPIKMKDSQNFFSSFAEVEVEVEEILQLTLLMFKYMPAHIEITKPSVIGLTSSGWNNLLNELAAVLHKYDDVARILQTEKTILESELRKLMPKEEKKE